MKQQKHFMSTIYPGAWVKVWVPASGSSKFSCWHHGIISGNTDRVIHFTRTDDRGERVVCETSIEEFLAGGTDPQVVDEVPLFPSSEVLKRAISKLGSSGYNLPSKNCEHFAQWCAKGAAYSKQVQQVGIGVGIVAIILGVISVSILGMAQNPWS